ncbi:DUF5081 family protein [Anaerosporobacter sp.]
MRISKEELLFINEVTKGPNPFGVFFKYPLESQMAEYKDRVIKSFQTKKLLDRDNKFTKEGIAILMLWEEYRKCEKHLIINKMKLAVYPNRRVIGIADRENEYELIAVDSVVILTSLLKECNYMTEKEKEVSFRQEKITFEQWLEELEDYDGEVIVLGEYINQKVKQEEAYYWKENKGFKYDMSKGSKREISPRSMRLQLMMHLELKKE